MVGPWNSELGSRFPIFIDVAIDVWERLHDWHVRSRLPIAIVRLKDGRYGMTFMLATLVLRPEATSRFIGPGYDAR